jgi:hypothetical protein
MTSKKEDEKREKRRGKEKKDTNSEGENKKPDDGVSIVEERAHFSISHTLTTSRAATESRPINQNVLNEQTTKRNGFLLHWLT